MKFDAILALAKAIPEDDLSKHLPEVVGNAALAAALKEIKTEKEAQRIKAAAHEIVELLGAAEESKKTGVNLIRQMRRSITDNLDRLTKIDRALAYGHTTNNYLPLTSALGMIYVNTPVADRTLFEIPKDFKMPEPAEKVCSTPEIAIPIMKDPVGE